MNAFEDTPLVSAIIPTFNRGWIVAEAVESALEQDYPALEIIVIDDGSTDDTLEKLDPFKDRIHILKQSNKGVSAARNLGIRHCSGQFVAFLDSDDLWYPGKTSSQIAFFKNNPEADICQTEEIWIRRGKRVNPMKKHKKPSGMIFEPSLHLCLVSPSAVMIRRTLFDRAGLFDETLPACEDYDLWLRIGMSTPIHLIETPGTVKRGGHADQLSSAHSLDKFRILSLQKLLESASLAPHQHDAALSVFKEKCMIYGQGCLKRGKQEEGRYYISLAE